MTQPKILHVDSGKEWRGGQAQVLHLLRGLRDLDWPQALVCPPGCELGKRANEQGIDVHEVKMSGEWDLFAPRRIAAIAREQNAAILHVHASQAHGLCWRALKRLPEARLVVTRRVDFAIGGNFLSRRKYRDSRTHYIAISSGVRDVLIAGGVPAERISIVHSGIDSARWTGQYKRDDLVQEFGLPDAAQIIVNIAALADHKGQKYLIDAVPQVLAEHPNAFFFIVGEGELRSELEQQISALNLQNRVLLTGFRKDVETFLVAADLFVLSSHLEGLCTSLLDAQWFAKAAVATSVGGIVDIIETNRNGWLVPAKDPVALAKAIGFALEHRPLCEQYGMEGRKIVEQRFSAKSMVEGTAKAYRELLNVE